MPYSLSQLHGADNVATTLGAAYASGVTTLVVADSSAFPAVPFTAALGSGTAAYEEVVVTSVVGATLGLIAPTTQPHPAGELVENTIGAEVLKRLSDFAASHTHTGGLDGASVAAGGVTDHTLLTNIGTNPHAQLDTHLASTHPALASAAPTTSAEGDAAAVGAGTTAARDNHVHGREAARPVRTGSQAAAATLTLPAGNDLIVPITGTTTITDITIKASGSRVTLEFTSAGCQVTAGATLLLAGANYVSSARGTLTLVCDGSLVWFEVGRSPHTDATAPVTQAFGDAAASGSATVWAKRDHKHGMPLLDRVRVFNSTNISLTTGVTTTLTFDSEWFDSNNLHSTSSNTSRLTCQTAGLYLIIGQVVFDVSATGRRTLCLVHSVSSQIAYSMSPAPATGNFAFEISTLFVMAVGEYVELTAFQDSGGSLAAVGGTVYGPALMMARVG